MIPRLIALACALLTLSGCVTYPDITQSRSPCQSEPGGWCGFVRDAAAESYPYAIAATNAYQGDSDVFGDTGSRLVMLDRLPIAPEDAKTGFDYQLFALYGDDDAGGNRGVPVARIMAFRGTDFDGVADLFYGTLRADQIDIARRYFAAERERFDDAAAWHTAGHSLGGALATEISIAYPDVRAWLFNLSPFYRGASEVNAANRTLFNERGEALRTLRKFRSDPAAEVFIINCRPQKSRFSKHSVRKLADCLTWIAAYESKDALGVVRANAIAKPDVECGPPDKPHPGRTPAPHSVCVHQSRADKAPDPARD